MIDVRIERADDYCFVQTLTEEALAWIEEHAAEISLRAGNLFVIPSTEWKHLQKHATNDGLHLASTTNLGEILVQRLTGAALGD